MRCDSVKELQGAAFRRLTGVRRSTFEDLVAVLFAAKCKQKAAGGKPNTLCIEDQLLMMLEYWREYGLIFISGKLTGSAKAPPTATSNGVKMPWPKARSFGYRDARLWRQASGCSTSS